MKALKLVKLALLAVLLFTLLGGIASAGDCAPAAVKVQQVKVQQVVVQQEVAYAQPVYVVPAAPTVAIVQQQVVYAQPVVVQQVVQQQKQVIVQRQKAPVTRSFSIQRSVTR